MDQILKWFLFFNLTFNLYQKFELKSFELCWVMRMLMIRRGWWLDWWIWIIIIIRLSWQWIVYIKGEVQENSLFYSNFSHFLFLSHLSHLPSFCISCWIDFIIFIMVMEINLSPPIFHPFKLLHLDQPSGIFENCFLSS